MVSTNRSRGARGRRERGRRGKGPVDRTNPKSAGYCCWVNVSHDITNSVARQTWNVQDSGMGEGRGLPHTVFFFARSPEAPRTTITVFSLSSSVLHRPHCQHHLHHSCLSMLVVAPSTVCCPGRQESWGGLRSAIGGVALVLGAWCLVGEGRPQLTSPLKCASPL